MKKRKYFYQPYNEIKWKEHYGIIEDDAVISIWINEKWQSDEYDDWNHYTLKTHPEGWTIPNTAEWLTEEEFKRRLFMAAL